MRSTHTGLRNFTRRVRGAGKVDGGNQSAGRATGVRYNFGQSDLMIRVELYI
jgi:hypothetical protein